MSIPKKAKKLGVIFPPSTKTDVEEQILARLRECLARLTVEVEDVSEEGGPITFRPTVVDMAVFSAGHDLKRKSLLCVKITQALLPQDTSEKTIEDESVAFMRLSDVLIDALAKRLGVATVAVKASKARGAN